MAGFGLFLLCCVSYAFLSRIITVIYMIIADDFGPYNSWEHALKGSDEYLPIQVPLFGDVIFAYVLMRIFLYYPFYWIGFGVNHLKERIEYRKKLKLTRLNYLNSLSEFGLAPSDIPKYVNDSAALKEYLKVWNDAVAENKRNKNAVA